MAEKEEKSGCAKFMSAIWQFPIFSIIFCGIVAVSSVMMYNESDKLETAVNSAMGTTVTEFKSGLLWTLIGIFVIDGGITFMSLISSQCVFECCWNKQMQKCSCCTQFICYTVNWFLFGMAYLLGLLSLLLTGVGTFITFFGIGANGLCEGRVDASNDADILITVNAMLKSIHDWVCENSKGSGMDCKKFPEAIAEEQIPQFCSGTQDIYNLGAKFFALVALVVVSQWSFAIIQRANLVEGAVRRDFAKDQNKETGDSEMAGNGDNVSPNV